MDELSSVRVIAPKVSMKIKGRKEGRREGRREVEGTEGSVGDQA
jgi:hypothetical protein